MTQEGKSGARPRGGTIAGFAGILIASIAFVLAAPAGATIFPSGDVKRIGKFKVLDGHFEQEVVYLANYQLDDADGCWLYKHSDTGSASYDLTFERGEISGLRWNGFGEITIGGLFATGNASMQWSGTVHSERLSDDEDCPGPSPLIDTNNGCGAMKVKREGVGLGLIAVKGNQASVRGRDAALFGAIFDNDPFNRGSKRCPSDSVFGGVALGAPSKDGMEEIARAKVGEKVTLSGKNYWNRSGPDGFFTLGDWTGGSQEASVDWLLKLKRLKRGD